MLGAAQVLPGSRTVPVALAPAMRPLILTVTGFTLTAVPDRVPFVVAANLPPAAMVIVATLISSPGPPPCPHFPS